MNVVGYKVYFAVDYDAQPKEFYMNVVGYKADHPALFVFCACPFYMNVVGYKEYTTCVSCGGR